MVPIMCRTKENKMKRFLILIVLVLAGCGEAEDTAKVNRWLGAGDVCVQINNR